MLGNNEPTEQKLGKITSHQAKGHRMKLSLLILQYKAEYVRIYVMDLHSPLFTENINISDK